MNINFFCNMRYREKKCEFFLLGRMQCTGFKQRKANNFSGTPFPYSELMLQPCHLLSPITTANFELRMMDFFHFFSFSLSFPFNSLESSFVLAFNNDTSKGRHSLPYMRVAVLYSLFCHLLYQPCANSHQLLHILPLLSVF